MQKKTQKRIKVIIMGAAGRDFHNFNVLFRDNKNYEVICFTAAQIPHIAGRVYPKELAGNLYPKGIPIFEEKDLPELIKKYKVDAVILSYSDLSFTDVMHKASIVNTSGASFVLMGGEQTMLFSKKPIISVCAVRTGCGKSQTTRKISSILRDMGYDVVIVRHPMPYGDLRRQICQRFASFEDMDKQNCTIEEREEYEQHIKNGFVVYAGVDYEKILREAEKEADIIIWDGGNNDTPFFKPDLHIVVADPHRSGHELSYYPGETNLRLADVVIINKENTAKKENIDKLLNSITTINEKAVII
ncbi:MAG: GTPase, partial [Candidatus Aenigmatarchaeota archaeon]